MSFKARLLRARLKIIIGVLVLLLAYGGWEGWKYYQYTQSSQCAFEMLKESLKKVEPEALAEQVDFPTLVRHVALCIAEYYPFIDSGAQQRTAIEGRLLQYLRERLAAREGKARQLPPDEALQQPLQPLPPDFVKQLQANISLNAAAAGNPDMAFIRAVLHHPQLDMDFTLIFLLQRTRDGWKVTDLANARELIAQFRQAQLQRYEARRLQLIKQNADIQRRMDATLQIQSCEAAAGVISDNKTLLTRVIVMGRNASSERINGSSLQVDIQDASGKTILSRYLDKAMPMYPGQPFMQDWTIEMAADSETGRALLQAGTLQCKTRWQTQNLDSGRVLYLREIKEIPEDFR